MSASNPKGDSTITGLPLAQTLNGSEQIPADQNQSGTLATVRIPSSQFISQGPYTPAVAGGVTRTTQAKFGDLNSVKDVGAIGNGSNNDFSAFSQANTNGGLYFVPDGTFNLGSALTTTNAGWLISPNATFTGTQPNLGRGFFSDVGNPPQVWRFADRVRIGHNKALFGDLQYLGSPTFQIPQFGWAERESSNHTVSPGRMAVTGVSQQSLIQPVTQASFTASISGTLLTVSAVASGTLQVSQFLQGAGIAAGKIYIASLGTGTGGPGTYNLNVSGGSVGSEAMTSFYGPGGIGVSGFCLNDDTTYGSLGWGAYAEAYRVSGAGAIYAMELDVGEGSSGGALNNPYNPGGSAAVGILLNSGGSTGLSYGAPASAALIIGNNGNTFSAGIVFNNNALATTGGNADAVTMAKGHQLKWYSDATHVAAVIRSDMTTAGSQKNIFFKDTAIYLGDANNNTAFIIDTSQGSNDGFQFTSFATGQNKVRMSANGADTNIAIQMTPQGNGNFIVTTFAKVFATKTSAQSLTNNAATIITGWTTTFDANSNFNAATGTFTAPATGYYLVSAQVVTASAAIAAGTVVTLAILNNGSNVAAGETTYPTASGANSSLCVQASALLSMTAGQTMNVQVYQDSGAAVNTTTSAAATYLSILQVA